MEEANQKPPISSENCLNLYQNHHPVDTETQDLHSWYQKIPPNHAHKYPQFLATQPLPIENLKE